MKFICEGLDLSDALLRVSKALAARTTVEILQCIRLSAKNDGLTLLASDGELSIEKKINADVLEEGEICVFGKTFTDFINKLSGVSVSIAVKGDSMEIRYGDNATLFQVLPASDFPEIDRNITENSFTLTKAAFRDVVARTTFCCAADDSRPILKGELWETENGKLTVTALDGFRMAVVQSDLKECTGKISVVCPARTLNEIARMLDGDEGDVTVYTQNGMMMVRIDSTLVLSRLYHGEFINYRNITPADFTTVVEVGKEELIESVERASVLIRGDKNDFILLELKNDGIRISSNSEMGNVSEKVPCAFEGKELKIAMKAKYVLEATKAIEADRIVISFNTSISPFILRAKEENGTFYLVLPVRTNF